MGSIVFAVFGSVALFLLMLISVELGYRLGWKHHHGPESIEVIGTVDAAVFGLLGLMLAFTYSGAADRLVMRRAQIVQETNAIGTAYLRLSLLPAPYADNLRPLFREYLERRIEVFDKIMDQGASEAALHKSEELQREIWDHAVVACRADERLDACLLLLPALNEMIDITTTRGMAVRTHAPTIVLALLVLLSVLAATLSGFAMSSQRQRSRLHMVVLSLVVSSAVYVVLDLEFPRAGLITLRSMDEALYALRQMMH